MTLNDALRSAIELLEAQRIEDARLDAELLLAEARGLSRAALLAHLDDPLDESTRERADAFVTRRVRHEPVAYILGRKAFYGLDLLVDRRVLIPRPETELLVEEALGEVRRRAAGEARRCTVDGGRHVGRWTEDSGRLTLVDVGTGSGAVAVALAVQLTPTPTLPRYAGEVILLIATDISAGALEVARANAERHGVLERIRFVRSDLLAGVDVRADLIVANLPYVALADWANLAPDIAEYEPRLALDGGADGLDAFRRFFAQAPSHLAPDGVMMLEIGAGQAQRVSELARAAFAAARIEVKRDLAGLERVVVVRSAGEPPP